MDLERERAAHALKKVTALEGQSDDVKKRYRSYVDRFGGAVVMNGLGQALATELAAAGPNSSNDEPAQANADKAAHRLLADHVSEWLTRDGGVYAHAAKVMEAIVGSDQGLYLRAQAEVLAWLTWHKKFCHAYLPKGSD